MGQRRHMRVGCSVGRKHSQHPGVLERGFAQLGGLLLELLDDALVDTSALVDQVASGGRLAGIDVADDDDVDVLLLLAHGIEGEVWTGGGGGHGKEWKRRRRRPIAIGKIFVSSFSTHAKDATRIILTGTVVETTGCAARDDVSLRNA